MMCGKLYMCGPCKSIAVAADLFRLIQEAAGWHKWIAIALTKGTSSARSMDSQSCISVRVIGPWPPPKARRGAVWRPVRLMTNGEEARTRASIVAIVSVATLQVPWTTLAGGITKTYYTLKPLRSKGDVWDSEHM